MLSGLFTSFSEKWCENLVLGDFTALVSLNHASKWKLTQFYSRAGNLAVYKKERHRPVCCAHDGQGSSGLNAGSVV